MEFRIRISSGSKQSPSLAGSLDKPVWNASLGDRLVSINAATKTLDQLKGDLLRSYIKSITKYEERAVYERAFFTAVAMTRQTVSTAWKY